MALFPQWLRAHFCSNQGCLLCLLDLAEHLEGGALLLMTRSQAFQFACVSGEGKPLDSGVRSREGLRVLEPEAPNGPSDAVVSSVPPERRPGYRVPASSFPWRWWWQVTRPPRCPLGTLGAPGLQSAEDCGPVPDGFFSFLLYPVEAKPSLQQDLLSSAEFSVDTGLPSVVWWL